MNTVITGHVINNRIVIDSNGIALQEGTRVKITILPKPGKKESGLYGIWEDERPGQQIADQIREARTNGREIDL
jgi:hypothetical protein